MSDKGKQRTENRGRGQKTEVRMTDVVKVRGCKVGRVYVPVGFGQFGSPEFDRLSLRRAQPSRGRLYSEKANIEQGMMNPPSADKCRSKVFYRFILI